MSSDSTDDRPVVLVTGASSGIGRATAVEFARRGNVRLVLVARRRAQLAETARLANGAGVDHELLACDLTDPDQLAELVDELRGRIGRLDVLVNNAGASSVVPLEDADTFGDVDRLLALNLRAPIALVGACHPLLAQRGGCVVNVSSVAGLVGTPQSPVYSATKWGLTGFSEAIRARYAQHGVRVCCVQPGPVPTPGFPHPWLAARPLHRRLLAAEAEQVAKTIVRCATGSRGVSVVLPRTYAPIPLLRGLAPWFVRRLLATTAVKWPTPASRRPPSGTSGT